MDPKSNQFNGSSNRWSIVHRNTASNYGVNGSFDGIRSCPQVKKGNQNDQNCIYNSDLEYSTEDEVHEEIVKQKIRSVNRMTRSIESRRDDGSFLKDTLSFPRSFGEPDESCVRNPFVLQSSLFSNVPPTIYFGTQDEKILGLPSELQPYLKWRLSTITPNLIKETVERSGFRLIKEKNKSWRWSGTWCKHMKCNDFNPLHGYQKVNHFPGSFHLGRKDKLWLNFKEMEDAYNDEIYCNFHPKTWILPQDLKELRKDWVTEVMTKGKKMILKPPASARGNGITVIHKWTQIPKSAKITRRHYTRPVLIVQDYISNPCLLFNGAKFDLRVYVLVTSFYPLRIYVYDDGLVRFASVKYSSDVEKLDDQFMHLTNYSVNKRNHNYEANHDINSKSGHKWSLKTFWKYLRENVKDVDVDSLWSKILDMIIRTLISCKSSVTKLIKKHLATKYTSFELLGFDIMLDDKYKPWLLEVNISPSLRSESTLDTTIKSQLIADMFNIVGYRLPYFVADEVKGFSSSSLLLDSRLYSYKLTKMEKAKHDQFEESTPPESPQDILDILTPTDVRCLIETEDEFSRCGHFARIFPSDISSKYLKYMDEYFYYDNLLDAWENRYKENRLQGIRLLRSLCHQNFHLSGAKSTEFVVSDPKSHRCARRTNRRKNPTVKTNFALIIKDDDVSRNRDGHLSS